MQQAAGAAKKSHTDGIIIFVLSNLNVGKLIGPWKARSLAHGCNKNIINKRDISMVTLTNRQWVENFMQIIYRDSQCNGNVGGVGGMFCSAGKVTCP